MWLVMLALTVSLPLFSPMSPDRAILDTIPEPMRVTAEELRAAISSSPQDTSTTDLTSPALYFFDL